MNISEQELDIKKELRASMNGILSARMREAGMPFILIFGVELPRLQNIASEFRQDESLAERLWQQNIRETRLLAIMLMPVESFTPAQANVWLDTLQTAEEAQVLAMMLLQKTKDAKDICLAWLKGRKPLPCICACLCLRHLLSRGIKLSEKEQAEVKASTARMLPEANLHLRKAILVLAETME